MITELRTKLENAQGAEVRLQALQAEMANGHKGVQIVYQDRIVEKTVEKDKIVEKVVYVSAAVCGCRQGEVYIAAAGCGCRQCGVHVTGAV